MMEIHNVTLASVCAVPRQIPEQKLPEVVFAGKSNVGKSSLINCLLNRKKMARVSSSPGKTVTVNFYSVENKWMFVDLPGYGYAAAGKAEQERFSKVTDRYLKSGREILRLFLLVDIRREPSDNDRMMLAFIRSCGYTPVVIATKADKLSRMQQQKSLSVIRKGLDLQEDELLVPFSSETKVGRDEVWDLITNPSSDRS